MKDQDQIKLIHQIAMYQGLYDKLNADFAFASHYSVNEFSDTNTKYFQYCLNAFNVEKRNYPLLVEFLKEKVRHYKKSIKVAIEKVIPNDLIGIKHIYDVGAGHDLYADILHSLFPDAKITLVDKRTVETKYDFLQVNAKRFVKDFDLCKHDLVFMSELLHCKTELHNLVDDLKNTNLLIHEPLNSLNNACIDLRLKQTGGGLIPEEFYEKIDRDTMSTCYKSWIPYMMVYVHPQIKVRGRR